MQLNWLIYVNIQSRAVLLNHGLKQQICRGSFGRLHIEKEEALLDTKTRQALFAGPIVFEIMMHLTENDKVYFWLCHSIVRRWGELEVSVCRLVMMGNISKKTTQLSYTIIHVLRYRCLGFQLHLLHLHFLHFEGTIIILICYRIYFQCLSMNFSVVHTALLQLLDLWGWQIQTMLKCQKLPFLQWPLWSPKTGQSPQTSMLECQSWAIK